MDIKSNSYVFASKRIINKCKDLRANVVEIRKSRGDLCTQNY